MKISKENHRAIEKGNTFFVQIYFKGLKSSKGHTYAFIIGDTYVIKSNPTNLTSSLPKEYKEISYVLDGSDGSDEDDDEEEEEKHLPTINKANIIEQGRRTRHDW